MEFCGCDNPIIQTKEEGMTLVILCSSCGASVATTNTKIYEESPWLTDEKEYMVIVLPEGIDKSIFIEIMKKNLPLSTKFILNLYQDRRPSVAFKGKGQQFYNFCQYLNMKKAKFSIEPKCSYVKST